MYYHQGKKVRLHTQTFLKCNEPEGTQWISDGIEFLIVKKDTTVIVSGVRYDRVMVVREGKGPYVFYAKGAGKIMEMSGATYQRELITPIFNEGKIDPSLIGTWIEDKHPGYWASTYFKFTEDGKGESGNYNSNTRVFSKPFTFKWRVKGGTLYRLGDCADLCFFESNMEKTETGVVLGDTKYKKL